MSSQREPQPQTVAEVLDWYESVVESIIGFRAVVKGLSAAGGSLNARFTFMSPDEVEAHFVMQRNNLEALAILNLMASAESAILADYWERIAGRYKDPLSKAYVDLYRNLPLSQKARPPFDNPGILEILKDNLIDGHLVNDFRDALRLRHWIAHGRHWAVKLSRNSYLPDEVARTINSLLIALPA